VGRQLKYDQARLAVLNIIAGDNLQPGDRLLPEMELLERIPCSRITLRKALEALGNEGMIERHVGKGTYLKRSFSQDLKREKVVFVNVLNSHYEAALSPRSIAEMEQYFHASSLDFEYLNVQRFSEEILRHTENALGVLLYGWLTPEFMDSMKVLQLPMIIVGNSVPHPGLPQVSLAVTQCAELVTDHFIAHGARRIALLNARGGYYMADAIARGFHRSLDKHHLEPAEIVDVSYDGVAELLDDFLNRADRFDAIVAETGIYLPLLVACRFQEKLLRITLGLLPYCAETHYLLGRHIFRNGPKTVFGVINQSLFLVAAEILLQKILNDRPMHSVRLAGTIMADNETPSFFKPGLVPVETNFSNHNHFDQTHQPMEARK